MEQVVGYSRHRTLEPNPRNFPDLLGRSLLSDNMSLMTVSIYCRFSSREAFERRGFIQGVIGIPIYVQTPRGLEVGRLENTSGNEEVAHKTFLIDFLGRQPTAGRIISKYLGT